MDNNDELMEFTEIGKQKFNISKITKQTWINYGYALLTIAGADGVVSKEEMAYLVDGALEMGATDDIIQAWHEFDFKSGNLEELLPTLVADAPINAARSLLYSSIQMSWADDDFPTAERDAVSKAAELMGLNEHIVQAMIALVEMERSVENLRFALLEAPGN